MFGWEMKGKRKRTIELLGMCKEKGKGTIEDLNQILLTFALKLGLRRETAQAYLDMLIDKGFIVITHGEETWVYNGEREQEIFGVTI